MTETSKKLKKKQEQIGRRIEEVEKVVNITEYDEEDTSFRINRSSDDDDQEQQSKKQMVIR